MIDSDDIAALLPLVTAFVRAPDAVVTDQQGNATLVFDDPLSDAQAATLATVASVLAMLEPLRDVRAVGPDVMACIAFEQLASPSAAQSIAALQSLTRVVGHLLARELLG